MLFGTTRKTVYKWLNRYEEEGPQGLIDRSRAPKRNLRKIPLELEERIVSIRKNHLYLGPYRIKEEFSEGSLREKFPVVRVLYTEF